MFEILFVGKDATRAIEELFESSAIAQEAATKISADTGKKVRIKEVVQDEAWREREATRMTDGTYKPLPEWWHAEKWWAGSEQACEHFAHFSNDGKQIAFTESPEKGSRDLQSKLTPTKYLAKFFAQQLTSEQTRMQIGFRLFEDQFVLKFCGEPETFQRIYENGGNFGSCMSGPRSNFANSDIHPAYVYGSGDFQMAWLETPEGEILARTIICLPKKNFPRVYSKYNQTEGAAAGTILDRKLREAGFRPGGDFEGMRLLKRMHVTHKNCVVTPSVDGTGAFRVEGDFLILSRDGKAGYVSQCGYSSVRANA